MPIKLFRKNKLSRSPLLVLAAFLALIPVRLLGQQSCSTMAGNSQPIANSAGTLILPDLSAKTFRWVSNDSIFGPIDTGVIAASAFTVSNTNPPVVAFTGVANGVTFQGNILLGTAQRGTVNVYTADRQISYLIAPPQIKVTNIEFDWKTPDAKVAFANKTDPTAAITIRKSGSATWSLSDSNKSGFIRPLADPVKNTGDGYGEWAKKTKQNAPAAYVANQMVTIKVRFTSTTPGLLAADISATAQKGLIPNVKTTAVTFTGGANNVSNPQYVEMAFDGPTRAVIDKESDTWQWQLENGCGNSASQLDTSGPHTVYTVLALPNTPWYDNADQQPWTDALDFVTDPQQVNLVGVQKVDTAAQNIANFLFSVMKVTVPPPGAPIPPLNLFLPPTTQLPPGTYGLRYDTGWGAASYVRFRGVFDPSPIYKLTLFMESSTKSFKEKTCLPSDFGPTRSCIIVNCYDLAASASTLINLIGGNSGYFFDDQFGYMQAAALIGVGTANNPFYNQTDGGAFQFQKMPLVKQGCLNSAYGSRRSRFKNHAFVTLNGLRDGVVIDAMAGPFTGLAGTTTLAYLVASIDPKPILASGKPCEEDGSAASVNGSTTTFDNVGAARLKITLH